VYTAPQASGPALVFTSTPLSVSFSNATLISLTPTASFAADLVNTVPITAGQNVELRVTLVNTGIIGLVLPLASIGASMSFA